MDGDEMLETANAEGSLMTKNSRDFDPTQGSWTADGQFIPHLEQPIIPEMMPFDEASSPQETNINREQRKLLHLTHTPNHAFRVQQIIHAQYYEKLPSSFTTQEASKAANIPIETVRRVLLNTQFFEQTHSKRMHGAKKPSLIYATRPWRDILADLMPFVRLTFYERLKSRVKPTDVEGWQAVEHLFKEVMWEFWGGIRSRDSIQLTLLTKKAYLKHYLLRESDGEPVYVWQMERRCGMTYSQLHHAMDVAKLMWTKDNTEREISVWTVADPDGSGTRELSDKATKAIARRIAGLRRPDLPKHYVHQTAKADSKAYYRLSVPRFIVPRG